MVSAARLSIRPDQLVETIHRPGMDQAKHVAEGLTRDAGEQCHKLNLCDLLSVDDDVFSLRVYLDVWLHFRDHLLISGADEPELLFFIANVVHIKHLSDVVFREKVSRKGICLDHLAIFDPNNAKRLAFNDFSLIGKGIVRNPPKKVLIECKPQNDFRQKLAVADLSDVLNHPDLKFGKIETVPLQA